MNKGLIIRILSQRVDFVHSVYRDQIFLSGSKGKIFLKSCAFMHCEANQRKFIPWLECIKIIYNTLPFKNLVFKTHLKPCLYMKTKRKRALIWGLNGWMWSESQFGANYPLKWISTQIISVATMNIYDSPCGSLIYINFHFQVNLFTKHSVI